MYSSSFYGNLPAGQPAYGQQPAAPPQQPAFTGMPSYASQQQPGFMSQPTGFGAAGGLMPQRTGYPAGSFGQAPQSQQPPVPPMPSTSQFQQRSSPFQSQPPQFQSQQSLAAPSLQLPQFTGISQRQPSAPQTQPLMPQPTAAFSSAPQLSVPIQAPAPAFPTGQTSSQMAQSFQSAAPQSAPNAGGGVKIPNQRLSFITATDQAKFEQLFKSAVGSGQSLDGSCWVDLLKLG